MMTQDEALLYSKLFEIEALLGAYHKVIGDLKAKAAPREVIYLLEKKRDAVAISRRRERKRIESAPEV